MTEVNIPLLRKAVEWAEAEAAKPWELSEWHQASWIAKHSEVVPSFVDIESGVGVEARKSPTCGTCYCIAGFVTSLETSDIDDLGWTLNQLDSEGELLVPSEVAQKALGLTHKQASDLFTATNTVGDVRRIAEEIAGESL